MFFSHTQRNIYRPGDVIVIQFLYGLCRPPRHSLTERIMSINISVTPSGIEPATFRLTAHCFNKITWKIFKHRKC